MLVLPKLGRHFDRHQWRDLETIGCIMIGLEDHYGNEWLAGALVEYINNRAEYCICTDQEPNLCVRCAIRERLGMAYDPARADDYSVTAEALR